MYSNIRDSYTPTNEAYAKASPESRPWKAYTGDDGARAFERYIKQFAYGLAGLFVLLAIILGATNGLGGIAIALVITLLLALCCAGGFAWVFWATVVRRNVRRETAMIVDFGLAGFFIVAALLSFGGSLLFGGLLMANATHYYGFWGQGDRQKPWSVWSGQHPANPPKAWENATVAGTSTQLMDRLTAKLSERCLFYGMAFEVRHGDNGLPLFVIDGEEYPPGVAADKFLPGGFQNFR